MLICQFYKFGPKVLQLYLVNHLLFSFSIFLLSTGLVSVEAGSVESESVEPENMLNPECIEARND